MTHTISPPRPLLHEFANEFSVLYGTAELFAEVPGLSVQQRRDVAVMLDALGNLAALIGRAEAEPDPDRPAADLRHELRTPLHALLGFAELLLVGDTRADCLLGVVTAARHMAGLLDGAGPVAEAGASAGAVVAQAVLLASEQARGADVRLVTVNRAAGDAVRADPLRLRQVVLNLLTNAIGCSPPGGEVRIVVSRNADTVTVAFLDQGPGLTADEIAALRAARRGERAHGLGLPITRELVAGMAGSLGIRSKPGRGSRFSISLPAHRR